LSFNGALHYTRGFGYFEQYKADEDWSSYGLKNPELVQQGDTIQSTNLIRRLWLDNHFYGGTYAFQYIGNGSRLNMTLGGAWNQYIGDHFGEVIWAEYAADSELGDRFYENDADKRDFNIFLKTGYELGERLNLFVDLQYRQVDYSFLGFNRQLENVDQDVRLQFFNPKAGLFYQISERASAYASFAVANREPNRNDYTNTTPDSRPLPERLNNTEIGFQQNWDKAMISLNAYHMQYKDQLAVTGELNDVGEFTRTNIPDSYRLGIELAGGLEIAEGLRLEGNATLSQNRIEAFTEFVDQFDENFEYLGQGVIEHEEVDLAFSPGVIAGAALHYSLINKEKSPHQLEFSLLNKYVGQQYVDNTSNKGAVIDPYFFSDLRLRYVWKGSWLKELELTVLVRNLWDAQFETNAYVYRFQQGETLVNDLYYYPQAGRNFLVGVNWRF
jgi:iron complex outermembrane receptor protein